MFHGGVVLGNILPDPVTGSDRRIDDCPPEEDHHMVALRVAVEMQRDLRIAGDVLQFLCCRVG